MNTPGDDDFRTPPGPTPPDPFRHPSSEPVEPPRFGEGGTDRFRPDYAADSNPPAPQPPPPQPAGRSGDPTEAPPRPPHATPVTGDAPTRSPGSRKGLLAPVAAAIVLVGGIGLLIVNSGGDDEPESISTPRIAEVNDPDEPVVQSTVPDGAATTPTATTVPTVPTVPDDSVAEASLPIQTSPPLVEPTTIPATEPPPVGGGPTQAELDAALVTVDDLASDDWFPQEPEFLEFCDSVPDVAQPVARADSLFGAVLLDPPGARQISNTLITFESAELAEQAFTSDVAEIVACDATTTDLDGDQYRVQVSSDSFSPEQSASFPCADQSSSLIVQLTNESLSLPYIAQSTLSFRCGRNVTITSLSTTIDLEDLQQDDFFNAAATSNASTGELPGS